MDALLPGRPAVASVGALEEELPTLGSGGRDLSVGPDMMGSEGVLQFPKFLSRLVRACAPQHYRVFIIMSRGKAQTAYKFAALAVVSAHFAAP